MSVDTTIQTENFKTFVDKAKYFCTFLETYQSDNFKAFLSDTQKQLIWLYTFGQILPEFDLPIDSNIEEVDITDEDIKELLSFIADRLRDPFYWVVFDPTDHSDTASVCGDLIDDLGDMYKDIRTFLIGFDNLNENVKQNALWHLKWSFDNHWSDHCVNAIYAIHYFIKHADN